jgi:hypothetical protein
MQKRYRWLIAGLILLAMVLVGSPFAISYASKHWTATEMALTLAESGVYSQVGYEIYSGKKQPDGSRKPYPIIEAEPVGGACEAIGEDFRVDIWAKFTYPSLPPDPLLRQLDLILVFTETDCKGGKKEWEVDRVTVDVDFMDGTSPGSNEAWVEVVNVVVPVRAEACRGRRDNLLTLWAPYPPKDTPDSTWKSNLRFAVPGTHPYLPFSSRGGQ